MILKLGMKHRIHKLFTVYINDDPGLTMIYFTSRSNVEARILLPITRGHWLEFYDNFI